MEVDMQHMDEVREELRQPALDLQGLIPDVMKGFGALSSAAMAEGELSGAVKELLAVHHARVRRLHRGAHARRGAQRRDAPADGRGDRGGDLAQRGTGHRLGTASPAQLRRGRGREEVIQKL
jgi:hypothetical protein